MKPIPIALSPTRNRALNMFLGLVLVTGFRPPSSFAGHLPSNRPFAEHGYRRTASQTPLTTGSDSSALISATFFCRSLGLPPFFCRFGWAELGWTLDAFALRDGSMLRSPWNAGLALFWQ